MVFSRRRKALEERKRNLPDWEEVKWKLSVE